MIDADAIASEVLGALDTAGQIERLSTRIPGFSASDAYRVAASLRGLRTARGERQVGRKIGFTNRSIWPEYNVYEPIWGDMYDTTVSNVVPGAAIRVSHLPEPRIEPEIVLGVEGDVKPGMSAEGVLAAIGWIAHGFEIVQSIYPGWRFAMVDCVANNGLHGALAIGPKRVIRDDERNDLLLALATFTVALSRNDELVDRGVGSNVLDGPVQTLVYLLDVLGRDQVNPGLRRGEIITTGTLTRAFPIVRGERWSTELKGLELPGLSVTLD